MSSIVLDFPGFHLHIKSVLIFVISQGQLMKYASNFNNRCLSLRIATQPQVLSSTLCFCLKKWFNGMIYTSKNEVLHLKENNKIKMLERPIRTCLKDRKQIQSSKYVAAEWHSVCLNLWTFSSNGRSKQGTSVNIKICPPFTFHCHWPNFVI